MTLSKMMCGLAALALVACGGKSETGSTTPTKTTEPATTTKPTTGPASGGMTPEAQVAAGEKAFGENCASCHGDNGQGKKKALALIGDAALPKDPVGKRGVTFRTAADVLGYMSKKMPKDDAGGLKKETYAAILAFMLTKSNRKLSGPLTAESAARIVLNE